MHFTVDAITSPPVPQDRRQPPRLRRLPRRQKYVDFGYSPGEVAVILEMSGVDVLRAIRDGQLRVGTHHTVRGRDVWGPYNGARRFARESDLYDRVVSQAALDEFQDMRRRAAHVAAAAGG